MKRILLAALLAAGCVTSGPPDPSWSRHDCVYVVVDNHRFNDVVLYDVRSSRRYGVAHGVKKTNIRICALGTFFEGVRVREMGSMDRVFIDRYINGYRPNEYLYLAIGLTWNQTQWLNHDGNGR